MIEIDNWGSWKSARAKQNTHFISNLYIDWQTDIHIMSDIIMQNYYHVYSWYKICHWVNLTAALTHHRKSGSSMCHSADGGRRRCISLHSHCKAESYHPVLMLAVSLLHICVLLFSWKVGSMCSFIGSPTMGLYKRYGQILLREWGLVGIILLVGTNLGNISRKQ